MPLSIPSLSIFPAKHSSIMHEGLAGSKNTKPERGSILSPHWTLKRPIPNIHFIQDVCKTQFDIETNQEKREPVVGRLEIIASDGLELGKALVSAKSSYRMYGAV